VINKGQLYYVHNDHLGTPQKLTNTTGSVVWAGDYDPFGNVAINEDVDGNTVEFNVRLPGQYYDEETGLHYNYFRYYDPQTGRYITSDPIGLQGGLNTYGYVGGNPVNWIDPEGLAMIYGGSGRDGWDPTIMQNNMPKVKDPCGCFEKVLGYETAAGAGLVASGLPVIPYPRTGFGAGSSTGATSLASSTLSKLFPQRFPRGIPVPTISNMKARTPVLGRAMGRFVPFMGWGILAYDVAQLASCLANCEDGECKSGN